MSGLPLEGILVVALEQAVAAPFCTSRLADAGARVLKIERAEGDFARSYDSLAHGESAYFVWLNRGKESVVLDLLGEPDRALLERMIARADILVQNLKPGAMRKIGFDIDRLRRLYPRLICCSISGYGDEGPYASRKAYDLLIQAEAGLASITGGPEAPARVGVSVVDIVTGANAQAAILEALIQRGRTGEGADIRLSLFDSIADWCSVPLLQHEGGKTPQRLGLAHPSISPYGVFSTQDGAQLLISIQSDREWVVLAEQVLQRPEIARHPDFATNSARCARRTQTDGIVADIFTVLPLTELTRRLLEADIAFAAVNDMSGLARHPQLRRITIDTPHGPISYPSPPARWAQARMAFGAVPALGEHTRAVKAEFAG